MLLGVPVEYELSVANVDKPRLTDGVIATRVKQFDGVAPVWLTEAPRFAQKAELFPGVCFVVGLDTAIRLLDARYSGGTDARDAGLRRMLELRCTVLVGGRIDAHGVFRTWGEQAGVLAEHAELFREIPTELFRADISSTQLRAVSGG